MKPLSQDIFYEKPGFAVCWYDKELEAIVQEFEAVTYWTSELIEAYKQMQDAMLEALSSITRPNGCVWPANGYVQPRQKCKNGSSRWWRRAQWSGG